MINVSKNPLVAGLVKTGTPHIRVSENGLIALDQFRHRLADGQYELSESGCLCDAPIEGSLLVAEEDRYGLPFKTFLCRQCGLLFTSPRMSQKSVARFYEVEYRPIYRGKQKATPSFFEDQIRHGRQIAKRLEQAPLPLVSRMIVPGRGGSESSESLQGVPRIFDIGCGAGGVLMPFKQSGWQCFGCDYGVDYLERGREAGLTLEAGSFETLRKHAPANVIVASHVLEHCLDPVAELRGWSSLLAPNGLVYIEVPGLFDVYRNYKSLAAFFHVAHTFNFTLDTLTAVTAKAGLERIAGNESVWAIFKQSERPPTTSNNVASRIERFLRRNENGILRIPREIRRHFLRQVRGAAKRVPFAKH